MANIPLTGSDYKRTVAKEPYIALKNRFTERNPALSNDPLAVISRPALKKFAEVGQGPIRRVYSQPGTFNDNLFVISNTELYEVDTFGADTLIGSLSTNPIGAVSMAATAPIQGSVPAYLYIAEGGVLWCYTSDGHAQGHLEATGAIANGDDVVIGGVYYTWVNTSVDAGTPDGTSGNPWLVALGSNNTEALTNLYNATNATGVAGTDYSTALTLNPNVGGVVHTATDFYVQAREPGTIGNAYSVSETGAGLAWTSATLTGGGAPQLRQVQVPDDLGAISVAVINSFVIVVPVQEAEIKGRFYWIEPGETVIDPLNFATAERSPDAIQQVVVFGDMFWLMGQTTTEPWVTSGDETFPMQRFTGILFDRGSWEGCAVQIKDHLLVIDQDGGVFLIKNGQRRLSEGRPDIEERIRKQILAQSISS